MKTKIKDWLLILASLLDDLAVALLLFLVLRWFNVTITWPVIIFLAAVFGGSILIIHKLIIPVLHRRKVNGVEGMMGLEGKVVEPLNPTGLIKSGGEYWKARTADDYVAAGKKVDVIGFKGLTLIVKPKKL
jgi:membrane-bound ClpP family serine protease